MWTYILILLLQLGELIDVKFFGTISVAGIFYIIWFLYNVISGAWALELRSRLLLRISILYLSLFFLQLVSEVLVGNEFSNAMKGLAVTVLSYMKLLCLWPLVKHDRRKITWLFFCMVISGAISFQFLTDEEFQMDSLMSGAEYSIFKFKIAPLLGELLVVFSLIMKRKSKLSMISMFIGAVCAVLGARSTGLMIFLAGGVCYAIEHMSSYITKQQVITWSIVGGGVGYAFFVLYVNAVLSGTIVGGNSKMQFENVSNPYNPLNILLAGRTESPASLTAISDRPWTGFGAWAKDPGFKYHKIQAKFQKKAFVYRGQTNIIPSHSVVLQTGVNEGVFAMSVIFVIVFLFVHKGAISLRKGHRYNYLVVYCIMQLLWNGFFSPVNHFRNSFPIYFCCCLFAYRQYYISRFSKLYVAKNISINCDSWRKRIARAHN